MLIDRILFRCVCAISDRKIKKMNIMPNNIVRKTDIPYGMHGRWNLLDVYYPKTADRPLPVIINIHGGGYVYGSKELYQCYCMDLARRGFTVVNFNYRLVPHISFPSPVHETNEVMQWVCANAADYYIDLGNVFMAGDSAGAQIASQYCAIVTNAEYAKLFDMSVPDFKLKAVALNCGMYDKFHQMDIPLPGLLTDYFGKDPLEHGDKINVLKFINERFPPAFIASAVNDFLLPYSQPFFDYLGSKGVESVFKVYGAKKQKNIKHIFHLNIFSDAARQCNDDECDFFKTKIDLS
jgi:acetyl esterase/lipase